MVRQLLRNELEAANAKKLELEAQRLCNPSGAFRTEPYHASADRAAAAAEPAARSSAAGKMAERSSEAGDFYGVSRTELFLNMQRSKHQWVQKKSKIQG